MTNIEVNIFRNSFTTANAVPGVRSPSVTKAMVLLQLGDLNWRNCHNLDGSLKALREAVAVTEAPAKTKQDVETWIRMLTEPY